MVINIYISFFLFLSLFFSGCSSTKFKKRSLEGSSLDLLKSGLSKACLSGEGRGRFYTEDERHTFSFESLLSYDEKRLDISYHFPFHGEETLSVFYKEAPKDKVTYQGSLFEKIKKDGVKEERESLKEFFSPYVNKLGQFLFIFHTFKEGKDFDSSIRCGGASKEKGFVKGECVFGKWSRPFGWEASIDHFSFFFDLPSHDGTLKLIFDREKEKLFSKWTVSFYARSHRGMPLKIENYITSCKR